MMLSLDKIYITGSINNETPRIIIMEILRTYGIVNLPSEVSDYNLIYSISKKQPLKLEYKPENYPKFAYFVNPEGEWKSDGINLKKAYDHLMSFNSLYFNETECQFGPKTETCPYNIDLCLMFKLCKDYNLTLNRNTRTEDLIKILNERCEPATQENLIKIFMNTRTSNIYKQLHMPSEALIVIATLKGWGINILSSQHIKHEYYSLCKVSNINLWEPYDKEFKKCYKCNPHYFKVYDYWTPEFHFIYSRDDIIKLAKKDGIDIDEPNYEQSLYYLQTSRLLPNFYLGKHIRNKKESSIDFTPIDEINPNKCVSYGIIHDESPMELFTFENLIRAFETYNKFSWEPKSNFSIESINKLKMILSSERMMTPTSESIQLENVIRRIENVYRQVTGEDRNFVETYNDNIKMIKFLHTVLELGMYMRGWKLKGDGYPLTTAEASFVDEELGFIENNVIPLILKVREEAQDPEISQGVEKIRMVQYKLNKWSSPNNSSFGMYLLDKLDIILKNKGEESCIRWSSNFIIGGAYFYLEMMGHQPKFSISELSEIL